MQRHPSASACSVTRPACRVFTGASAPSRHHHQGSRALNIMPLPSAAGTTSTCSITRPACGASSTGVAVSLQVAGLTECCTAYVCKCFYSQMRMKPGLRPRSARPPAAVDQTSAGTHTCCLLPADSAAATSGVVALLRKLKTTKLRARHHLSLPVSSRLSRNMHQQCESPHKTVSTTHLNANSDVLTPSAPCSTG